MTAQAVLAELDRRGVSARVVGDKLRLTPIEALDETLIAEARRLKPELMRLLTAPAGFSTPTECGWCGGALAPYLIDLAGRPALLCPSCHRWTVTGRPA